MLEKDTERLIKNLSGIIAKDAILTEGIGQDTVVKIPNIVFFGEDLGGPFVSAYKTDETKVHPKIHGFTMKKEGKYIIFQ